MFVFSNLCILQRAKENKPRTAPAWEDVDGEEVEEDVEAEEPGAGGRECSREKVGGNERGKAQVLGSDDEMEEKEGGEEDDGEWEEDDGEEWEEPLKYTRSQKQASQRTSTVDDFESDEEDDYDDGFG